MGDVTVKVTEVMVSALPLGDSEAYEVAVWLLASGARWIITRHRNMRPAQLWSATAESWVWEQPWDERTDAFTAATRYTYDEALTIATRIAPSAAERVLAWRASRA